VRRLGRSYGSAESPTGCPCGRASPGGAARRGIIGPVRFDRLLPTAALAVTLTACSALPALTLPTFPVPAAAPTTTPARPTPVTRSTDAVTVLATLPVKGRAPRTGYARDEFGPSWSDIDRNGCDQRNDVLARDMTGETFKPARRPCVVLTGTLRDPYTGRTISFVRGQGTSEAVQIDHVVALSDSWQKGAQRLPAATRLKLGNDPLNLLAVDGPTNQSKGDGDAATWLPPVTSYRCAYVARQVAVKAKYALWVTTAERDAIARILRGCPGQKLPPDSGVAA
jgi:Protein of unknown function (DUF1524)